MGGGSGCVGVGVGGAVKVEDGAASSNSFVWTPPATFSNSSMDSSDVCFSFFSFMVFLLFENLKSLSV
jgi:hypothetical protein